MNSHSASKFSVTRHISEINAADWNSLTDPNYPFLDYEFLAALENSGCVGGDTGWSPFYLTWHDNNQIVGAMPVYEKTHSFGEFLYDWHWPDAFEHANIPYFPKGVVTAPFTPATGKKILTHIPFSEFVEKNVAPGILHLGQNQKWQSIHFAYLSQPEQAALEAAGFIKRIQFEYTWKNHNYRTFNDFLARLKSQRRKQITKERRKVAELGLNIRIKHGHELTDIDTAALYDFYAGTHDRKMGNPLLNKQFFQRVCSLMPDRILCVLAYTDTQTPVAGTFNLLKGNALFGRYWGCTAYYPNLHFECCYYQLIEYAIENNLKIVEAGAQGEHKFFRGFNPEKTYYAHFFSNPRAHHAMAEYIRTEREQINDIVSELMTKSAYGNQPE